MACSRELIFKILSIVLPSFLVTLYRFLFSPLIFKVIKRYEIARYYLSSRLFFIFSIGKPGIEIGRSYSGARRELSP